MPTAAAETQIEKFDMQIILFLAKVMLIIILTTVLLSEEIILVVLYRVITASSHFNP